MAKDYYMAKCTGDENVRKAIAEMINKDEPWELHSVVPAGLKTVENLLQPGTAIAIMNYLVIFERESKEIRVDA